MLSKEEELRVAAFIDAAKHGLEKGITCACEFYVTSVLWLAEKLKETNDELKRNNEVKEKIEEWMSND